MNRKTNMDVTMVNFDLISSNEPNAWKNAVERCGRYDSYHTLGYHQVACQQGEGEPFLFAFEYNGRNAALPFLLRPVTGVDGLEESEFFDAVSAYGYPGLLTSVDKADPNADDFRTRFQDALRRELQSRNVVTLFVRQNPLIDSSWMLESMANVNDCGQTVAIDLTLSEDELFANFRKDHRRDIRKARRQGLTVFEDSSFERIEDFIRIYSETMDNVGAAGYYYFPKEYFVNLKERLGSAVKLFLAELDGEIVSGAMFMATDRIVQYHLSGKASKFRSFRGAIQVLLNEARIWGAKNGFSWLHLGGGVGAQEDSLFEFKSGFSDARFQFHTARAVLSTTVYEELIHRRCEWIDQNGLEAADANYFPAYRAPLTRRAA